MIRWGIMGLGNIAHEFAQGMKVLHPIYGACARDYEKTKAFCETYQVEHSYHSYEEMLEDENIDIVYIATVNSQHYQNIMDCLKHGKHVLCEKAIWGNYEELKKAYAYAMEHQLLLCEAMTIYHMPIFTKIKEMIAQGILGKIKLVEADLGSLKEDDPQNRFFSKELGGGAMLDIGTYTLSFLRFFLEGNIQDMKHVMCKYSTGVDEMWGIGVVTDQDEIGNANMTFRAKLPKRAVIAGDKAYITVFNYVRAQEAVLTYPDGKTETIRCGETEKALTYEIQDIEECIRNWGCGKDHMEKTMGVVYMMDRLLRQEGLL